MSDISWTARLFTILLLYSLIVQLNKHGFSCHSVTSLSSSSSLQAFCDCDSDILDIKVVCEREGHRALIGWSPPGSSWPVLRPRTHVRHSSRPVSDARTQRPVPSHHLNIQHAQDGPEDEWKTVLQPRTLPDGTVLSRLIASRPPVCDGL